MDLGCHRGIVAEILIHIMDHQRSVFGKDLAGQAIAERNLDLGQRLAVGARGCRENQTISFLVAQQDTSRLTIQHFNGFGDDQIQHLSRLKSGVQRDVDLHQAFHFLKHAMYVTRNG
jgi:hypothetical protein